MAKLSCGALNCSYNKDRYCSKGDIMVSGKHANVSNDTSCDSFHRRMSTESYSNAIIHPSEVISIDCEVDKCLYNDKYRCTAKHVDIKGKNADVSTETNCDTFKQK